MESRAKHMYTLFTPPDVAWLIEVHPTRTPTAALRERIEFAPGIVWDGLCGCWLVPHELLEQVVALLEGKDNENIGRA